MAIHVEDPEDIVQRGEALYHNRIRALVEAGNRGKFLIINVDTGEYEMDAEDLVASRRARARFPNARLYTMRVGFPTAYRIGATPTAGPPS